MSDNIKAPSYMDYLNRDTMSNRSLQRLNAYDWDFVIDFTKYKGQRPTELKIKQRLKNVSGISDAIPDGVSIDKVDIRGFAHHQQKGMTNNYPPAITFNLQDFEDQSLKLWLFDWAIKLDNPTTHKSWRREDLMVDVILYRLNENRHAVWEYRFFNCLPNDLKYAENFADNKDTLLGECSVSLQGEYWLPIPLLASV